MTASIPPHGHASVDAPTMPIWRVAPDGIAGPLPVAGAAEPHPAAPQNDALVRRRQLLRGGFWAGIGVLLAGGAAVATEFLVPRVSERMGSIITVEAAHVPKPGGDPYHVKEGRFWLVNLKPGEGDPEGFSSFGAPSRNGGLLALYQGCTHLNCLVPWRPDFDFQGVIGWFRCPCHGATYTKAGLRVFGPAPRSMDTFRIVQVSRAGVRVNTGAIVWGTIDDPQRAIPAGPFS